MTAHASDPVSRLLPLLLCAAALGCELGNDLQSAARKIANPAPETVETGGRQVAEGEFRQLRFDGTTADDAFVVALKDRDELVIIPFSGAEHCSVGRARVFTESLNRNDHVKLDARIPFVAPATETTPETLRFTNFACEVDEVEVPGAGLPLSKDFTVESGFIAQSRSAGELFFVSPWSGERRVIGRDATPIVQADLALFASGARGAYWMWSIEAGELVARDSNLEEVFRAGTNVTAVWHGDGGGGGPMLALLDDQLRLSTVSASAPNAMTTVAEGACEAQFNTGTNGRELLFYSPCEERTLRVHELDTGTTRTIRSGIVDYRVHGSTDTGPLLLYLTDEAEEVGIGTVWARWGQNDPIRLGRNANFRMSRLSSSGWARIVVDWDGQGGTLMSGQLGEPLEEIAAGVAYYSSVGLISDFDGYNGDLHSLNEDNEVRLITESVSIRGIRIDQARGRALLLSGFDGVEGRLTLVEDGKARKMTERVRPSSYQFTVLLPMVTLLSDLDATTNTATLKMHRTDRDEELEIATGVIETVEVAWPTKGLLYSAPAAEIPGIYFVRTL